MTLNEKLLSTPKLFSRENDIIKWGCDRNIIGDTAQGTFEGQQEKTRQEWQEWKDNHSKDDCGDVFVTLVMQCALKGTTVSECVKHFLSSYSLNSLGEYFEWNYSSGGLLTEEDYFDEYIQELLEGLPNDVFEDLIGLVVDGIYVNAKKRGWTLEECIDVAWDDIKDRKGIMCHGTFVKQSNIDALKEVGVEFDKELQAFVGECFLMRDFLTACTTFDSLGFTFEQSGTITTGIKLKTTGSK